MESRNKLTMCRLCLCENECFINIFEMNDWQGYVAAEVISDFLQFQVSETDGYPHVVCSKCLVKLTDIKLFKECCQKSKVKYDDMFTSSERLVEPRSPVEELFTVKSEPIYCSENEDSISKASNDHYVTDGNEFEESPMKLVMKQEKLDIASTSHDGSGELFERNTTEEEMTESEVSGNLDTVKMAAKSMEDSIKVNLALEEIVRHPQYIQRTDHKRPQFKSQGEVDAASCTRNFSTGDESKLEKTKIIFLSVDFNASSSRAMDRLEGKCIQPRERTCMDSLLQGDVGFKKEEESKEIGVEDVGERETAPEKIVGEERFALAHADTKPYKCAECSKSFSRYSRLIIHMRSHTGSKPYVCEECSKCFSDVSCLHRHMRTHLGSKPFKCDICSNRFTRNSDLKRHLFVHSKDKPYQCHNCRMQFSRRGYIKTHLERHCKINRR